MAKSESIWGIDIGQCALKALKLRDIDGELVVEAIDIVEHPTILSQSGGKEKELIQNSLVSFLTRNKIAGTTVAISVPGQSSFTRFVKLPPVESKRVPDIVRFEAEQQIPFAIEEVIWRWQIFQDPDSPDVEVGIFAMKRTDVDEMLDHFDEAGLRVDLVQMAPLALYNFMCFDEQTAEDGATLLMDIGTDKTDLVVADGPRLWTRTIQIGGGNFTQALIRAFKLSFHKAEQLKKTAATSKYAKQVFQSMRPVFSDLVQEVQRSIGYYTSLHRETLFKRLVGLGNGFRLPGLQRFLEQNLNMPVARIDAYNQIKPGEAVSAATFSENVLSFAVAYGTALAAMGRGRIRTNLLPMEIARRRLWSQKRGWFVAAAAVLLAALAGPLFRAYTDRKALADSAMFADAQRITADMRELRNAYDQLKNKGREETEQIKSYLKLFAYRDFLPSAQTLISRSIRAVAPDQAKLAVYTRDLELLRQAKEQLERKKGDARAEEILPKQIKEIEQGLITTIPRQQRRIIIVEKMHISYATGIPGRRPTAAAAAPGTDEKAERYFTVTMSVRTPLQQNAANDMLGALRRKCKTNAQAEDLKSIRFHKLSFVYRSGEGRPAAGSSTPGTGDAGERPRTGMPDPTFPGEDMANDTRLDITVILIVAGDGLDLDDDDDADVERVGKVKP